MSIVFRVSPLWATRTVCHQLFGLTAEHLRSLVFAGKVKARKFDASKRNSRTVYCCEDVRSWLENEAPEYVLSNFKLKYPAAEETFKA